MNSDLQIQFCAMFNLFGYKSENRTFGQFKFHATFNK